MASQGGNIDQVEVFTPAVKREWLLNRQIVYHTVSDSARTTLQEARKMFFDSMGNWPINDIYLAVNDFSSPDVSLSPSAQAMLGEIRQFRPELRGYIAIVMPNGFVSQIIRLFVRNNPGVRPNELFYTREKALEWLVKKLPSYQEVTE